MPFSCCSLGWIQTHYLHLSSNLPFIYLILHRLTLHLLIHFICLLVPLLAHSFINSSIHSVNCIIYLKIATGCHVHSAPSVEELVFFIPAFFPSFLKLPTPRKSEGPAYIPTSLLSCATFFFFHCNATVSKNNTRRFYPKAGMEATGDSFFSTVSGLLLKAAVYVFLSTFRSDHEAPMRLELMMDIRLKPEDLLLTWTASFYTLAGW